MVDAYTKLITKKNFGILSNVNKHVVYNILLIVKYNILYDICSI